MVSVRLLIAAAAGAATAAVCTSAFAADMPMPPPQYQPVIEVPVGGWYLRGDVGIGIQTFATFEHAQNNPNFNFPPFPIVQQDIQDTTFVGFGVGYEFNNWLRFDVTAEERTKAMFRATGSFTQNCAGGGTCFDVNSGNFSSAVFMANAYFDFGTWWCLTPYVGGGVGGARNTITGIQDNGINSDGTVGFGFSLSDNSVWNFAWNLQAGLTYNVTNNFKVDFNYRFLSLGSPVSAVVFCQNTPNCPQAFYTLHDTTSQELRIGFRWVFRPDAAAAVMPAQPYYAPQYAPQYVPQPQYAPMQPPLSSRG